MSWAGELHSVNWFDTARKLTERWHHQQQIRRATGRPGLMIPELYYPVLDCFMRGLPFAYRGVEADPGTMVRAEVSGECGGAWQIRREAEAWVPVKPADRWDSRIVVPQEIAWLVFTKGIRREEAAKQAHVQGDRDLALRVLDLTAIVA